MQDGELRQYVGKISRKMGLSSRVNARLNREMNWDGQLVSPVAGREYLLEVKPNKNEEVEKDTVRHELGHLYLTEKHPGIYEFIKAAGKPARIMSFNYPVPILPFLASIALEYFGMVNKQVILSTAGITLFLTGLPYLAEEFAAEYFGNKFKN